VKFLLLLSSKTVIIPSVLQTAEDQAVQNTNFASCQICMDVKHGLLF